MTTDDTCAVNPPIVRLEPPIRHWFGVCLVAAITLAGCSGEVGEDSHSRTGDVRTTEPQDATDATDLESPDVDGTVSRDTGLADSENPVDSDEAADTGLDTNPQDTFEADAPSDTADAREDDTHDAGPCGPSRRDASCVVRSCAPGYKLASNGRCVPAARNATIVDAYKTASFATSMTGHQLAALTGDDLLVYPKILDYSTGVSKTPYSNTGHATRISVWIDNGEAKQTHHHRQDVVAKDLEGNELWNASIYGCCNYFASRTVALKPAMGKGYVKEPSQLYEIDLETGSANGIPNSSYGGRGHVMVDGTAAYVVYESDVAKFDMQTGVKSWSKTIGGSNLSKRARGALTGQGNVVAVFHDGQIAHLEGATGNETWNLPQTTPVEARPGPLAVVDETDRVFFTTGEPAIWAVEASSGNILWKQFLPDKPHEIVVGDRGNLYAYVAPLGRIYAIDRASGQIHTIYVGLRGADETALPVDMILKDGSLIVLSRGHLVVFPVDSSGYPQNAPWPVEHHDNQRTSNLDTPLTH